MGWNTRSRSKYNNRKITIDNIQFDSIKEAARYKDLKLLLSAGKIKNLELQPKFILQESFKDKLKTHRAITYSGDFKYFDVEKNIVVVEDVKASKNFTTDVYKIKKKLFIYKYPDIYFYEYF